MKKLVIIPAYNESGSILRTVQNIRNNAPSYDIIVINDSSKDDTLQICQDHGIPVLDLPVNLGIGGAVQTGFFYAFRYGYDIAVQMDGDGQHDAAYLEKMEETLLRENADMVIGSRFIEKKGFQSSGMRRVGIRLFTVLSGVLFGKPILDATSGMRMCSRRTIELFVKDYPRDYPEPETVCRLLRKKYKVIEVPVIMKERESGESSISLNKSVYYMIKVTLAIIIERLR
ncbi:MAG: glycosyltransferase family 2 protein [Eubacteriales bacterium]|nr:glycosyltransferase family 2 protein [Sarcina sp.]MBR2730303.1 glycosyltransferase family 2 protein [Lachnospiraceae bacterium]MDO4417277.1 glycosyltransferase family 2 protein [Eubacteriales bacterium]